MKSVMQNPFQQNPDANIQRSVFNMSHSHKTTFDGGWLIPIMVQEIYPGDTMKLDISHLIRIAAPLKFPVMDNIFVDIFTMFCPTRLVWTNFPKLMGEREDPDPNFSEEYLVPQLTSSHTGGWTIGSVMDYMGLPVGTIDLPVSSIPLRCHNKMYNDWFRDENLIDHAVLTLADTGDLDAHFPLRRRCKRPDYFTSCLPWTQKGTQVQIPLGSEAPVFGDGTALSLTDGAFLVGASTSSSSNAVAGRTNAYGADVGDPTNDGSQIGFSTALGVPGPFFEGDFSSGLYADLSNATASTVNSLRYAMQLQIMLERDARGGSRYIEIIYSHFRVRSPDFRLQRSEFLGSSSSRLNVHNVPQTAPTSGQYLGNLGSFGISTGSTGVSHGFVEHGFVIVFVNVRSDLTYQQQLQRFWTRRERYDFYWPELANIGEQPVYNYEIYCQQPYTTEPSTGAKLNEMVFGYQEAWADLRFKPSMVTGNMRSESAPNTPNANTLDVYHMALKCGGSTPELNDSFIVDNPDFDRIVQVPSLPHFIADFYFDLKMARAMPVRSIPGRMDHF